MFILTKKGQEAYDDRYPIPSLDPDKLFWSKYDKAVKRASGLELFAFKVLPTSLLKSFVLKMDPTTKFSISPYKVASPNRYRENSLTSILDKRVNVYTKFINGGYSLPNYGGLGHFGPIQWIGNTVVNNNILSDAVNEYRTSNDTTRRTRPVGSDYGEFEKFKFSIFSPVRKLSYSYTADIWTFGSGDSIGWSLDRDYYTHTVGPQGAWISKGSLNSLRNQAITYANDLLADRGKKMLAKGLPTARRYSLWRNIVELKDVKQSVQSFRTAAFDLSQLERSLFSKKERVDLLRRTSNTLKDLPNEWLSYWFGWRALYKDILDLASAPTKAAKEIVRLQERSGKPTNYRITNKWLDSFDSSPLFDYDFLAGVYNLSTTAVNTRENELRLVLNATFDFPRVDIPYFKRELFLKKLGVYPSVTDIYNLTPWSWLLDWFTGVGDYLELIEAVNNDPSLINFGFLTAVIKSKHSTIAKCRTESTKVQKGPGEPGTTVYSDNWYNHTSVLEYEVQVRRNIPSVIGVSQTTDLNSLSAYQKSILAAILAQRVLPR